MCEIELEEATVVADEPPRETPDLQSYEIYALAFSGGKDSLAALLVLLESGVPKEKIELHHHLVDGRESALMDWPVTSSYCKAVAKAFGLRLYESWRVGGFEREMLRNGDRTAPVAWESEDGVVKIAGGEGGTLGTRLMFPQVSASLKQRWCSSVLKIDVFARVLTNEPRFQNRRSLVITGERAEESSSRAHYKTFEPHRTDLRAGLRYQRHIDHWRPVHGWTETQVWAIIQKYAVNPHPAYLLGFGRLSCRSCIFANHDQWATIRTYMPDAFTPIANYEREFKVTIHRTRTVDEQADRGTPYPCTFELLQLAESTEYYADVFVENWKMPLGAFKHTGGPS